MREPRWVLREAVLALHERLLAEFGGLGGLRDVGLFDSALARPQQLFAYGKPKASDLAAAYAFGLVRNHPFLDGNKRIGFATAVLLLEINGCEFTAPEADAVVQTLALAAGALDEAGYAAWLKQNSRRSKARRPVRPRKSR
jgi:death-on-curing protein